MKLKQKNLELNFFNYKLNQLLLKPLVKLLLKQRLELKPNILKVKLQLNKLNYKLKPILLELKLNYKNLLLNKKLK
jgi:hypothetical protein